MEWHQVLADPCLRDLPYKIELNREGEIVMNPASNRHALLQGRLVQRLSLWLGDRFVLTECSVATAEGVRVPDVAWASPAFIARHGDETPFSRAPELCVEIVSPSNSERSMMAKVVPTGACWFMSATFMSAVDASMRPSSTSCAVSDAASRCCLRSTTCRMRSSPTTRRSSSAMA